MGFVTLVEIAWKWKREDLLCSVVVVNAVDRVTNDVVWQTRMIPAVADWVFRAFTFQLQTRIAFLWSWPHFVGVLFFFACNTSLYLSLPFAVYEILPFTMKCGIITMEETITVPQMHFTFVQLHVSWKLMVCKQRTDSKVWYSLFWLFLTTFKEIIILV